MPEKSASRFLKILLGPGTGSLCELPDFSRISLPFLGPFTLGSHSPMVRGDIGLEIEERKIRKQKRNWE